jgi:hydrogenase-1 operon protein HyaF
MTHLSGIPVTTNGPGEDRLEPVNALPILHEVQHALTRLAQSGERTVIDLTSIPFSPVDEQHLFETLGRGEVEATVNALGPTRVWETTFSGVWLVDHRNTENGRLALQIEITDIPEILKAQPEDIADGLAAFRERIGAGSEDASS